ncbi:SYNE1 protein, partial [Acromyrmex heyeri]
MQKEEKPVQQEQPAIDLDTNPSQEKKRRQKKKKIDKSVGDEIDKALKEIEDMDKQKIRSQKDKLKEQNKEIKSRDSVNEMIEKHTDETDKKQSKFGEKSRKSKRSKEATRTKETISVEHVMLPSKIKASDKNILKDDVEDKKDTKDAKVSDSKNEEEIQKDITKEMSKELQLDNNSHINSNKLDVTKCKNKIDKDTKIEEQNGEASENKMHQSDVLKKNKTKSKEVKLEAEDSNINQEKLEINTKEIIEDKSLKSIKPLTDIEIKDSESKTLNVTKIASDVNESKKKKHDVPKSEQMIDEAKIVEAAVVQETSKEILLPETIQQTAQEIVQIDKNDKTDDSVGVKESKETEHQTNAKLEVEKVEKCQIKTTKQKKSEKTKSNVQDKRKENQTIIQEQFSEKMNLAEQHVSVLNNSCLVQSKTDAENNHGVKIDKEEDIVLGQINKSTEKPTTVPETDLAKPTTETLPKESEVSSEIKDIKKSKDVAPKEKMSKRTKKKERLSPKHTAEQTKQSFYDKFQEEIVFKDDLTKKEETPKFTNLSLAKIDNVDNEKTQESSKKNETETEFDSKVSSNSVDKAQVYKEHTDETHNNLESEQPSSTGKALIIEKMITTVTTTTSVPGSVKVKPPDVKSVKSVEIIENIPLPKIVGSKVTELITLRPETVEASLTTTYARVSNDSLVSVQSDQAAISQKVGLTSAISTENNVISDEMTLFGSVQDRKRVCSSTSESRDMSKKSPPMTSPEEEKGEVIIQLNDTERLGNQLKVEIPEEKRENDNKKENTEKIDRKTEFAMECESKHTVRKINSKEIPESSKIKKEIVPEHLLDLIKPYAMDRHAYNHAESNFHRYFKVVKTVKKVQPTVTVHTRPESIERIVQDSVMKPIDAKSSNQEMNESDYRRHAFIVEAPKYPIASFYEFESQWIKMKFVPEKSVSISSDDSEVSVKTAIEREKQIVDENKAVNVVSDFTKDTIAIVEKVEAIETNDSEDKDKKSKDLQQSVHLVSDDSWMKSIEEIREPTITLVSTSANNMLFNNNVKDLISNTNDSIPQSVTESNVSVEPSTEKIKIKEKPAKVSSVHLESDDAWMALLEEEIIIDDDFDELETIKDSQLKKREEDIEIKEAKTKQQIEEKEIKKKKLIIEKQEDTKNVIEKYEEDIEIKEQKTEILNGTSLTEIAVKDEYHTSIKDIKNETVMNEKQSDKTKNQPRKKKELKHAKVTKTKDQAKTKTANKQNDDIKTDVTKDDLSLQSNLEENKLENKSDCKTKEVEKSSIVDKQQVELHKDKEEGEKREERKLKTKKSKKQNQKPEVILKEKSALVKCEGNLNKDDSITFSKATESDVFETSSIVENQQESKDDMPKYDSRLNPNAKSWAAIVGKKGTTETTVASNDDFLNTQTSAITQDTNDNVTNVVKQPQAPTEYDSCEIPSKEETLTTHLPSLEKQISKNDIEELKATVVDEIKPIEEKSTELLKQLKESNKSYAQVTASSRKTSPQISQQETYSVKTIPLKTDHLAINVKTPISNEMHEDFITEKLQSPLERDNKQDEMVVQSSDYQTVITNVSSQEESIPWVEEVEKETMAISNISVDSINTKDNETYVKSENTWAAIVGKKSIESPEVNDIINLEQSLPKPEQNIEPPLQVQIYVEEAPKQEPIENLVQVDEQDIKAKEEMENKIEQSVQKTENEQRTIDENDELTKIMKEENAKSSKSRDKDKQKNDSNENKMQFAENKSHVENKIIQGIKSEPSATLKDTEHEQENKCKDITALPIIDQNNTTKSKKKKNKKGKFVIEQLSESTFDIDKKTVITEDLEKKTELPVESKLDEVKLEAVTIDMTCNILTYPENEEIPAEKIKRQENIKQSHLEKIEKNITEEKEIPKFTKAERRKQKKKVKLAQSKFTDSSEDINTIENIKIKEIALSKDKIDDESIIEIQSVQREEIEKPLEKFETINETSLPHITSLKDKQKAKSKSKSKKEKQQDDKTKSQDFTTTFTTEPKEIETLSIVENTEQEDIKELKENVLEAEEVPTDILKEKTEIDLPQTEESNNICLSKSDNILKLHDITINNDSTKIESVLISDKTNDEIETETPVNHVCMQKELPCDSVNTAIKHSLPSDKLSSTVQQSFEDEDKLKCIASTEQENSDILVEPSKSKVQFYIADEILVLNPDRRKHVPSTSFLQEQSTTDSCTTNSWFLSIDDGFWPDKRPYHEAERDHFENLALHTKKNLSHDSKRDSDNRQDHDDDNSGGGSGGRSWDSCGNSCSLLGTPQTERMIADLPGGICSWSDYSTYLSSESERTMDHNLPLGTIEDPTLHSSLSLDNSLPNEVQSSSPRFLSSSPPSQDPQIESCMESLANVEITPWEYPVSSSNSFRSSNDPSTCTKSSTFTHLPQSKLHLGKETREGSVQRCSPNGEVERETAKGEAERIRRIQEVEEGLASLQARLSNLEGTMSYLPRDSIESMLSSLMTILMELRTYDEDAMQLQKRLQEIPADIESQKLSIALTGIHTRVTSLLDQAEQGRTALEQARESREKRGQEIHTYKLFLEETDTWLRNVVSKLHEQHSLNTSKALQEELMSRARQVSELESLPEVSALAIALKEALLDVIDRLQRKQQEICDEEAQADDESTERDNATLDEAPSIHSSIEGGPPSLADVSLQTGQSLLIDDVVERKAQLTKQTSTTQMPPSTTCHSLTTQTSQDLLPSESAQTQEAIKVLKTTTGDHDVIEIATKYVPSSSSQEIARREQSSILSSEDIVVDMKYRDAKKTDSATSELNIVHAAPQSFETILVEPDDITTEVVVDADGTKRIIVRKLRRTTVTSRQTTQQRVSTMSTAVGDTPTMMQAFSEAAMRDQQVTMTRTRPDGTIETTTRQIYGGKVTTSAPVEGINVEEYESEPRYTRMVTQGQIGDISCQPVEEEILMEGGEYQTRTSSVHAVVQQVTRRVIKRTRKIIRKVTIVDGKEITTEEVIEEPEEVEIDEQDIPHISINVVKSEDQKTFPVEKAIEQREAATSEMSMGSCISETPMQGPFFGPFAKDITSICRDKAEEITKTSVTIAEEDDILKTKTLDTENSKKETTLLEEPTIKIVDSTMDTVDSKIKLTDSTQTAVLSSLKEHVTQEENLIIQADEGISTVQSDENVTQTEIKSQMDKQEYKHFPTEVNGTSTLAIDNQALIDAERSAVLQTPVEDATVQSESVKSPLEPAVDDEPVVTKATCKSDDAPVKSETLSIELENGTVEVETHHGDSSTVEADKNIDVSNVVLEKEYDEKEESKRKVSLESPKEVTTLTSLQKLELGNGSIALTSKLDISESDKNAEKTTSKLKDAEISSKKRQISPELFISEEKDSSRDEALKPEYKPMFHKVEISLSVRKEDEEVEPLVSIKTQAERPEIAPYSIVKEDVDINLPADKETIEVIHDKIVQTTAFLTAEKETETLQLSTAEKEVDVYIESPEKSKSDTSHKSRKKKRHKDKSESVEKPAETDSSTSIATSIAESMEINIPSSDSSKHASEQPQPDVTDIIKSESSLSLDDSIEKMKEDITKPEDEAKEIKVETIQQESKRETTLDDANTQTAIETCDVSTSLTPKEEESLSTFMQTSPEPVPITLEEEIQTAKTEETHMETQTFLEPGLDFSAQTIAEETPEVEDSGVQTMTPTATPMEEFAIQTSPIEDIIPASVETEDSQAQTTKIDVHSMEIQTSPVESSSMIATETQTAINTVTEVEQQTTPPLVAEKIIVQEISIQTLSEVPESFERDVQTSAPISPEQLDVSHTDTQTIAEPEVPAETTETQTTPEESPRKVELQESEMQTKSPEQTKETMMQTSPIVSPEPIQVCEESAQTSIEDMKQTAEEESQTSEISPKKTETSDSSVQIKAEELIPQIEESVQNIPEVCETSAQTSPKEEKQPTETISVSQQTTYVPTHTVEVSTEDFKIVETKDLSKVPVPITLEEMKKKEKIDLEKTPAAPDVQVPEIVKSVEEVKEVEIVNKLIPEIPTTVLENIVQMNAPVEKETKHEFSEVMVEHPKPMETITKTKESTPSSMSEKDNTSDTSFEIHVHATIELSASDTLDSVASVSKEATDTSQDTTIAEDLNNDIIAEHDNKVSKRQKRKRKHKTREITITSQIEPDNLQNTNESSHLGNILHIAHLEEVTTERLAEERSSDVRRELAQLKNAVQENDVIVVEETLVTVVETISTWLETIEYRIFLNRECPTGPSDEGARTFIELKDEVNNVEESVRELDNIWKQLEASYPKEEREKLRECVDALEHQVKIIEHVTTDGERHANRQLARWDEFLNSINNVYRLVEEQRKQLDYIIESEYSTQWKLQELDKLDNTNRCHMWKTSSLLDAARELLRDHPGKIIPEEIYAAHEITKIIEHGTCIERERLLQLLALAEEYEQTLQEFAQIIEIAENLLDSPISAVSLEHLQEEMQKHRKFFVNLNHCRAILESLEGNLDPETRAKHSGLHEELHSKATALLDQAASRAQQMALAASRWMLLEQGVKEERGWLQVAHQRVPDLQTVTSTDYDQYISLYQSLSLDVATHHARLIHLLGVARSIRDLIDIEDPEDRYGEALDVIVKLQDNIESSLKRLLAFRESWNNQEILTNRVEHWITMAEKELATLHDPSGSSMRQFWELKAQYEVHNNTRNEADNYFEQALRIIPLSDEMLQRQFHYELQGRWNEISDKINEIQKDVTRSISSDEISSNEKLKLLEKELNELRMTINSFHGVLKTEEELDLYVERLTILFERISLIQNEIGRLGLLPAAESERVGILLSSARCVEGQISEELDSAQLLKEKIQTLQRGLSRFRKAHKRLSMILDQCEGSERQESDLVAAAVDRCQSVANELAVLWQDLMALRQMLHNLPTGMRVTVSPVGIERDLSNIQDVHTELESRCAHLLSLLTNRLELWRRFERQLEMVQQSVQEADYMMELLTVQDSVDYDRLLKATERLEGLNGDLGAREVLIGELRAAAEPLRESCAAEVRERVDAAVNEAVQAWDDTRAELDALCTRYQHACRLWQQYRDSSAAVKAWVDTQMNSVVNLPPEEAVKQVKVCEETLAEHKERLAELRGLVAQIASDVGLDAGGPLHCEVEALGQRLEDVRETLSTLADTVDARVLNQELARGDLCQTKNFLDSVQQSLTAVGQGESNEQLTVLRNHLLALTRTEPQLQSIKDRALDVSVQEPSVVEVVQLWQRVFQETFQQYHRLSTRLIRSQDVIAALKLWEEYLTHVQDFLSSGMPGDYNSLSEHRNLCEVHRKLLPEQQNLILTVRQEEDRDRSVTEQFNALTNLHNETLARILERHTTVRDRISAWDRYKLDQRKLLTWLKEVERERQRMNLQFIHLRRLEKILQRIQALLDKMPVGETQIESLQEQQEYLLTNCDEALAVSIRMEHAANVQRIANLRAGLETWRDFVQRVQKLHEEHVKQSEMIVTIFQEIGQTLSAGFHAGPTSLSRTKEQLDSLEHLRTRLANAQRNLESLGVITEQLRECLSPSDMKTLNQQDALLTQQHGDLEYQLALLSYRLGERCALHGRWENRLNKLLSWMEDTVTRTQNHDTMALDEPEEALKRLECELQTEMSLKQRELEWLQNTGQELIQVAEETEKAKLQQSLDEVNEKWNRLMAGGKARANKLIDLIQTMNSLLKRIADLRTWLTGIESQLSEAIIIEKLTQRNIDKKLEDHDHLKITIEAESGNIGEVLNLCEILLNDCDTWKASFNMDAIKNGMESLEKRWKVVCIKSTERKRKIMMIWKLLQELEKTRCEHEPWLVKTEKSLLELENDLTEISKEESRKITEKAKSIAKDIEAHQKALKILEQIFGRLAKSGLDTDNFRSLTAETRKIIDRWLVLETRINAIISSIQREQKTYREFVSTHGTAVMGLTQVDVRLTQMQHLATPEQRASLRRRRQQLSEIEEELDTQNVTLRKADELALRVMQESNPDDVAAIQELVDEYQLLWRDIKSRVIALKAELETQERSEVDEAVQVETLKFERDTAVQVDTLPRLIRMTSCDAYLMELETALNECNNALNALEATVTPDPVSGPGLSAAAKTIAKLIGSCQSSIELVRHLHNLLMEDDKLSLGTAKSSEVTTLIARYETLIALARAREQQIRELRSPVTDAYAFPCDHDSGRLTCPLCSRRNWAQLDNDLWRLDKWLEYAEGTQSEQHSPPNDIEQLEDVIQDHREFLLDLDSHKSIVTSLNIVGTHLVDHTEDTERAKELRDRLAVANSRWEKISTTAVEWQDQLQHALMTNRQFYRIIEELLSWLERTEVSIRASEPIDLTESSNILEAKYNKFRELRSDLERCEPRVISLQDATNYLLDEQTETRTRLQELRLRLQSLRRLTGIYALKLGAALGLDPRDIGLAATSTSLASLSHDLLDEAASGTAQPHATGTDGDERDQTVLARGYRFLGRVLRVSLPIQALMLLLLGVASLVPSAEEDYSCMLSNNLARSFTPIAFYPNGPPPV